MEAFELLVAACFVQTHNVYVFTQTWTRSFRVRPRVGRSRSRDGRVSPSNIYMYKSMAREVRLYGLIYTRIRQSRVYYIRAKRKKRRQRVIRRQRPSSTTGSVTGAAIYLSLSFSSSPYPFSVRPSCERYAPSRMPCHPGEKNNISL